jgi:small nuclear ribonucleoprotein (snRNP)-like protein
MTSCTISQQASDGELNAFDLHMNVIKAEIATASENKPVERKGFSAKGILWREKDI